VRRPHTPPAELAEIRTSIVELLANGEADTRTISEWIGVDRSRARWHPLALVEAGAVRFVRAVVLRKGWTSHVWGAA
jgi:hypothetical protein